MTGVSECRDEARMITSTLAGDANGFHDLIRPYERTVYVMALSLLQNESDAEDAAQETFLKAFLNLASFRGEAKFSTWLVRIALSEAHSRLRRRKSAKLESLEETPNEEGRFSPAILRDWREIPSQVLERREVRELLQQAVTSLPLIYREFFLLRDVEELNTNESADALGISVTAAKVRLHRARMMLQKRLAPQLKKVNPKRRWLP